MASCLSRLMTSSSLQQSQSLCFARYALRNSLSLTKTPFKTSTSLKIVNSLNSQLPLLSRIFSWVTGGVCLALEFVPALEKLWSPTAFLSGVARDSSSSVEVGGCRFPSWISVISLLLISFSNGYEKLLSTFYYYLLSSLDYRACCSDPTYSS